MLPFYDSIYLSPHLDDAALSCGGQIFMQTAAGKRVLIVTIMAGNPQTAVSSFAQGLHNRWELATDVVAERRVEDIAACAILGADHLHWDIPDCIYRLHPETKAELYASEEAIFGDVHPAETPLVEQLATRIASLPFHGRLIAPLTLGHHIDHLFVRQAAEACCGAGLWFYEDYPYAQEAGALTAVIPPNDPTWQSETVPLSTTAIQAKLNSIASFKSQLSTFFNGRSDLEQQVTNYIQSVNGERLWKRSLLVD